MAEAPPPSQASEALPPSKASEAPCPVLDHFKMIWMKKIYLQAIFGF